MIIGIIGSRRRDSREDYWTLRNKITDLEIKDKDLVTKIITGDCKTGGDKFARDYANQFWTLKVELIVKKVDFPAFGAPYYDYVKAYYKRNEEIAKEEMDYLIALVAPDRTGGTENTIKHFKKHHKDWEKKLILI